MNIDESLLRAILATVAKSVFSSEQLLAIIAPTKNSAKQLAAYNLCDGRTPQTEISKKAKLDRANFSKCISKWVEAGIVFRIGKEEYPLHLYPLTKKH